MRKKIMNKMTNKKLEKILIADDDKSYKNYLVRALSKDKEYKIDFAQTADEEIEKAKQNSYDLIITDYDMQENRQDPMVSHGGIVYPEQTGLYAIKKIREFDKTTPIILNSKEIAMDVSIEALQEGANEVVCKGINWDDYKKIIEKYLTNTSERRYE